VSFVHIFELSRDNGELGPTLNSQQLRREE